MVSEVQADNAKLAQGTKEKSFLALLAEASGQQDALEVDPSPSPYVVQRILKLRGVCWALVGWCHLGSANKLSQKFLSLYAAPNLGVMGLRAPSLAEAEAADAELCRQLNLLMSTGVSLDKAIHEVVVVRNSLHMWLQPRAISVGGKKGKGKGKLGQSPLCPCFQERRQGRWQARIRTARQTGQVPCIPEGQVPARELQVCARVRTLWQPGPW